MVAQLRVVDANEQNEDIAADFQAFWTLYPRRIAKKDAQRAWGRIPPKEYAEILTALTAWRRVWMQRGELEFVPYPASWLNGERWTDELPAGAAPTSSAQIPFENKADTFVRGEMPEHVKALIRKLKAK